MEDLATGKAKSIPDVMIAAEKADIGLKLMMQVRNKVIEAYQEIMKMQV
jgi:flagellar hook-basal body complex protein FliE